MSVIAGLDQALDEALRERPRTFSLVIRVADWGATVAYESSGAGHPKAREVRLTPRDNATLAVLESFLIAAIRGDSQGTEAAGGEGA